MGCGRVGSTLAVELEDRGHSVSIIDQKSEAFRRLPDSFAGQQLTGLGFDRDVLEEAGIREAQGFAAVSSGDNSNIIAARVVRETFHVSNVVARIYDPQRAAIYERFGVPTVPTVSWTTDQVLRRLIPLPPETELHHAVSNISIFHAPVPQPWLGKTVSDLEEALPVRVAFIVRGTQGLIPQWRTVFQDGDRVRLAASADDRALLDRMLSEGETEASE